MPKNGVPPTIADAYGVGIDVGRELPASDPLRAPTSCFAHRRSCAKVPVHARRRSPLRSEVHVSSPALPTQVLYEVPAIIITNCARSVADRSVGVDLRSAVGRGRYRSMSGDQRGYAVQSRTGVAAATEELEAASWLAAGPVMATRTTRVALLGGDADFRVNTS